MTIAQALKTLINGNKPEITQQMAFLKLAQEMANDENYGRGITLEVFNDLTQDYKASLEIVFENNEKYLKSINRD